MFFVVLLLLGALGPRLTLRLGLVLLLLLPLHLRLWLPLHLLRLRLWLPMHLLWLERRLPVHLGLRLHRCLLYGLWLSRRLPLGLCLERRLLLWRRLRLRPGMPLRHILRGDGSRGCWRGARRRSVHLLLSGILFRSDSGLRGLLMLPPGPRLAFLRLVPLLRHHGLGRPWSSMSYSLRSLLRAAAIRDGTGCGGAGNRGGLGAPVPWRHLRLHRRRPGRLGHIPVTGTGGHRLKLPGCRNTADVSLHLLVRPHYGAGRQGYPGHAAVPGAGFHMSFGDGGREPRRVFNHVGVDQVGPHQVGPGHMGALVAGSPG
jgi:hypothetical protein